ncbi:carbon-nitrogen hydrolase [Marasmius fiardii PR-910]|nr:carbon-nitrogen hydrolase [Marasmius fiardii PR-910]
MILPSVPLRIAVVQFSPKIGQIQANIKKARELCRKIEPRSVDLVCFPEMAFSGYVFENAKAIKPYLEPRRTGPTSQFCSELAKSLECYVIAGYPERLEDDELGRNADTKDTSQSGSGGPVGANSAVLCGPDGEWVGDYRKTHLFQIDESWAKAGSGFKTFDLPSPLRRVSVGICMDLNVHPPHEWTSLDGPYELATYTQSQDSNVLILLNCWLDSGKQEEEECDWSTLNFWAMRLRPLWASKSDSEGEDAQSTESNGEGKQTVVIVCNRVGEENGKTFAGSSAIFNMHKGSGRPKILDMMGRRQEEARIWSVVV